MKTPQDRKCAPPGSATAAAPPRRIVIELEQMERDLCGRIGLLPRDTSFPQRLPLDQSPWFCAALGGYSMLPYVGELVREGKFSRFMRTLDLTDAWITRCAERRRPLAESLHRIKTALHWLPPRGNSLVAALQERARSLSPSTKQTSLPDIRRRFTFPRPIIERSFTLRTAHGRLGVPGHVQVHSSSGSHDAINRDSPGDDAGHLIGARFGAPDIPENLIAMNRRSNRGIFNHGQERHWAALLTKGYGIEATVTAVFRPGEDRPIKWRVAWIETSPDGSSIVREPNLLFGNFPPFVEREHSL
jgi:hypothetical protein